MLPGCVYKRKGLRGICVWGCVWEGRHISIRWMRVGVEKGKKGRGRVGTADTKSSFSKSVIFQIRTHTLFQICAHTHTLTLSLTHTRTHTRTRTWITHNSAVVNPNMAFHSISGCASFARRELTHASYTSIQTNKHANKKRTHVRIVWGVDTYSYTCIHMKNYTSIRAHHDNLERGAKFV